jgi:hypothetical protein
MVSLVINHLVSLVINLLVSIAINHLVSTVLYSNNHLYFSIHKPSCYCTRVNKLVFLDHHLLSSLSPTASDFLLYVWFQPVLSYLVSSSPTPCTLFPSVLHNASGFLQSYTMHLVSCSPTPCWFPSNLHHMVSYSPKLSGFL